MQGKEGFESGAQGRTRTGTDFSTRPSNVRVYQFRHLGRRFKQTAYFLGGAGAVGAAVRPLTTEARGCACRIARAIDVKTNATKNPVVSLCNSVVAPRAP